MKNIKLDNAIKKVTQELMTMPREEFMAELEKHRNGDIARILLYSGAVEVMKLGLEKK